MTVETPERAWTDRRLDGLNEKVDDGFAKMDAGFARVDEKLDARTRELRDEMQAGFEKADKKMDAGFAKADARMDAGFAKVDADIREIRVGMNRLMWGLLAAAVLIIGALIGLIGTLAHNNVL